MAIVAQDAEACGRHHPQQGRLRHLLPSPAPEIPHTKTRFAEVQERLFPIAFSVLLSLFFSLFFFFFFFFSPLPAPKQPVLRLRTARPASASALVAVFLVLLLAGEHRQLGGDVSDGGCECHVKRGGGRGGEVAQLDHGHWQVFSFLFLVSYFLFEGTEFSFLDSVRTSFLPCCRIPPCWEKGEKRRVCQ